MFFEVTLSQSTNEQVTVRFRTQDIAGQAVGGVAPCPFRLDVADTDYISTTSVLVVFPPGSTSVIVEVETCQDDLNEGDETLLGVLFNPSSNATIGIGSATGTIIDPDE
jgi:hypothetical protein